MPHKIVSEATAISEQLSRWRRQLHARPELSGEEHATAEFVARELRRIGIEPEERVGGAHGLTATLAVNNQSAVALRADMDALPIAEETGLDFASQTPGVMHACGHDAHMAMLLGAAMLLKRRESELRHSVKFIFQPEEERPPGGAAPMIRAGVLANVRSVFGLHVWSQLPLGTLGTRAGAFMSGVNDFHIVVRGKGGHAAMPHECVDPIVTASQIVLALQTAVSRSIALTDSAVVSVTKVQAGTATNIIPETTELAGTVRALDEAVRSRVCTRVRELAEGVARAHGATADVDILPGYPVLVNDAGMVGHVMDLARQLGWQEARLETLAPQGGGEDFAWYGQNVPAAFAFLGAGGEATPGPYPHHHARFAIDEAVLPMGVALLTQYALDPYMR